MEKKAPKLKPLAEDCFKIKISDFGKKLLYPIGIEKMSDIELQCARENKTLKGKQGCFDIRNGRDTLRIVYNVDQNRNPKILQITYNGMEQNIELEEYPITFGIQPFFVCACGKLARVLYKPHCENTFKCRMCGNITWESQRLNRHTLWGELYYAHRLIKLAKMREDIKRMHYNGGYSRKARRFMELYAKFSSEVSRKTRVKTENRLFSAAGIRMNTDKGFSQFN